MGAAAGSGAMVRTGRSAADALEAAAANSAEQSNSSFLITSPPGFPASEDPLAP
jgi:hypothetical protein